jgi:hypothetical protein
MDSRNATNTAKKQSNSSRKLTRCNSARVELRPLDDPSLVLTNVCNFIMVLLWGWLEKGEASISRPFLLWGAALQQIEERQLIAGAIIQRGG